MAAFLTLLVLQTRQMEPLLAFYRTLGLEFAEARQRPYPLCRESWRARV